MPNLPSNDEITRFDGTIFNTASSAITPRFHCVGGCWIEPRTVAPWALGVRHSNHSARSLQLTLLDLNFTKLDLIHLPAHPKKTIQTWRRGQKTGSLLHVIYLQFFAQDE